MMVGHRHGNDRVGTGDAFPLPPSPETYPANPRSHP